MAERIEVARKQGFGMSFGLLRGLRLANGVLPARQQGRVDLTRHPAAMPVGLEDRVVAVPLEGAPRAGRGARQRAVRMIDAYEAIERVVRAEVRHAGFDEFRRALEHRRRGKERLVFLDHPALVVADLPAVAEPAETGRNECRRVDLLHEHAAVGPNRCPPGYSGFGLHLVQLHLAATVAVLEADLHRRHRLHGSVLLARDRRRPRRQCAGGNEECGRVVHVARRSRAEQRGADGGEVDRRVRVQERVDGCHLGSLGPRCDPVEEIPFGTLTEEGRGLHPSQRVEAHFGDVPVGIDRAHRGKRAQVEAIDARAVAGGVGDFGDQQPTVAEVRDRRVCSEDVLHEQRR
jgi:hypothetical protein